MITWTTYGTWLQGDDRHYVKNGKIFAPNKSLMDSNKSTLVRNPVKLSKKQRKIAHTAIIAKAEKLNQTILALAVGSSHIHIVAEYIPKPIGRVASHYKNAARLALNGTQKSAKLWTKGFDKRYCFDKTASLNRTAYVNSHDK